jgi:hypothetical protein
LLSFLDQQIDFEAFANLNDGDIHCIFERFVAGYATKFRLRYHEWKNSNQIGSSTTNNFKVFITLLKLFIHIVGYRSTREWLLKHCNQHKKEKKFLESVDITKEFERSAS